jgi:hypothetical protein
MRGMTLLRMCLLLALVAALTLGAGVAVAWRWLSQPLSLAHT